MNRGFKMALKFKLDTLDGVAPEIAAEYTERDGAFFLNVDGAPAGEDVSGLKAQNEKLLNEKKTAEIARKNAEKAATAAAEEKARAENDSKSLAEIWEKKNEELAAELAGIRAADAKKAVTMQADDIANDLAKGNPHNAKLLSRFLSDRLRYDDGAVKVTDEKGNLTVSSVADLAAEFRKNEMYSSLIVVTQANGGGANGGGSGGATGKTFNEMNSGEKTALLRSNRPEYERLKAAANSAD